MTRSNISRLANPSCCLLDDLPGKLNKSVTRIPLPSSQSILHLKVTDRLRLLLSWRWTIGFQPQLILELVWLWKGGRQHTWKRKHESLLSRRILVLDKIVMPKAMETQSRRRPGANDKDLMALMASIASGDTA